MTQPDAPPPLDPADSVEPADPANPPWGWTRTHRIGLAILLTLLLAFLFIQYRRNPIRLEDAISVQAGPATSVGLVDPNFADESVLRGLPKIGPSTAGKIVAFREQFTADHPGELPFKTVEDLGQVQGIGKKTIDSLRAFVNLPSADELPAPPPDTAPADDIKP